MDPVWPQTCDLACSFGAFVRSETVRSVAVAIFSIVGLVLVFFRTRAILKQASAALAQAESSKAQADTARISAQIAERQAQIAWDGQLADRFIKTSPLLGAENINGRVGAIISLEEIARQSARHHEIILELLAAFVREWISRGLKKKEGAGKALDSAQTDIALSLEVIGRLKSIAGRPQTKINLARCDLSKYLLTGDFSYASFDGCLMNETQFIHCRLTNAVFDGVEGERIVFFDTTTDIASPSAISEKLRESKQKSGDAPFGINIKPSASVFLPGHMQTASSASYLISGVAKL